MDKESKESNERKKCGQGEKNKKEDTINKLCQMNWMRKRKEPQCTTRLTSTSKEKSTIENCSEREAKDETDKPIEVINKTPASHLKDPGSQEGLNTGLNQSSRYLVPDNDILVYSFLKHVPPSPPKSQRLAQQISSPHSWQEGQPFLNSFNSKSESGATSFELRGQSSNSLVLDSLLQNSGVETDCDKIYTEPNAQYYQQSLIQLSQNSQSTPINSQENAAQVQPNNTLFYSHDTYNQDFGSSLHDPNSNLIQYQFSDPQQLQTSIKQASENAQYYQQMLIQLCQKAQSIPMNSTENAARVYNDQPFAQRQTNDCLNQPLAANFQDPSQLLNKNRFLNKPNEMFLPYQQTQFLKSPQPDFAPTRPDVLLRHNHPSTQYQQPCLQLFQKVVSAPINSPENTVQVYNDQPSSFFFEPQDTDCLNQSLITNCQNPSQPLTKNPFFYRPNEIYFQTQSLESPQPDFALTEPDVLPRHNLQSSQDQQPHMQLWQSSPVNSIENVVQVYNDQLPSFFVEAQGTDCLNQPLITTFQNPSQPLTQSPFFYRPNEIYWQNQQTQYMEIPEPDYALTIQDVLSSDYQPQQYQKTQSAPLNIPQNAVFPYKEYRPNTCAEIQHNTVEKVDQPAVGASDDLCPVFQSLCLDQKEAINLQYQQANTQFSPVTNDIPCLEQQPNTSLSKEELLSQFQENEKQLANRLRQELIETHRSWAPLLLQKVPEPPVPAQPSPYNKDTFVVSYETSTSLQEAISNNDIPPSQEGQANTLLSKE